ncbi:hypothetical protein V6C03_10300 [Methyloligella sp. 2.7D]|uniref:hypothetical protein n=1 Tax=unclassified Methyloligella TaxID=2625955 RepID=UPI00157DCD3E|nr:hypothetical protein [Methyloligella sp. GL2]QKP77773.1 hypothetical protein HT051_10155 [Methyloligella sp. GL2]
MAVYLDGTEVEEADGLERAAELLAEAKLPVIAGLMTDIAGAQSALALAQKIGGVVDHAAGEGIARASRLMREGGMNPVSFGELRNRSDRVVVLGEAPLQADPDLLTKIFPEKTLPRPGDNPRELIAIGCKPKGVPSSAKSSKVDLGNQSLATGISMLAAAVAGRSFGDGESALGKSIATAAKKLKDSAFAVFVYSPLELDEPSLHVVLDMIRELCKDTRAGGYTVAAPGNGDGVNLCSVWTCGLPVRTSFAHGKPEHDAWRYSAERLVKSGEGDALVWVDALGGSDVKPPKGVPTILITNPGQAAPRAAKIVIEVGVPGEDHDAALYLPEISGIGMIAGKGKASGLPQVSDILDAIGAKLNAKEAA